LGSVGSRRCSKLFKALTARKVPSGCVLGRPNNDSTLRAIDNNGVALFNLCDDVGTTNDNWNAERRGND
jgi:hypothetical protein